MMSNYLDLLKRNKAIAILCLAIFFITLSYAFYFRIRPAVDAQVYDQVAVNILEGRGFRLTPDAPIDEDEAISFHTPLYQFFLAGAYLFFGHHYEVVWVMQAILHTLSALFIFLICRRIFSNRGFEIGLAAAALFGFHPDLIEMSAILMTETLSIFFLVFLIYLFFEFHQKISHSQSLSLGLVFGLTVLVRSTVGLFLPFFIFHFYRLRAYKQLALFLAMIVLALAPWTIRNYLVYNRFIPTAANAGYNLWVGNHEGGDGEGGNMPELFEAQKKYGIVGANDYGLRQFKKFVKEKPMTYARLTASRIMKYFSPVRPMGFWFYQRGWSQFIFVVISAASSFIIFSAGFAGVFLAWAKERKNLLLIYLLIFAILTVGSVAPVIIETRYRLPIYVFMAIFGGFAIVNFLFDRKANVKYMLAGISIILLNAMIDFGLEFKKIIEKIGLIFYS